MGLDMYLIGETYFHSLSGNRGERKGEYYDLGYWRKHPNLHGYIVGAFANGIDECQRIELSAEDLRQIIAAIHAGELPHTTGFFFGESDGSEKPQDLEILRSAIQWLEAADKEAWRSIYYQASW